MNHNIIINVSLWFVGGGGGGSGDGVAAAVFAHTANDD